MPHLEAGMSCLILNLKLHLYLLPLSSVFRRLAGYGSPVGGFGSGMFGGGFGAYG